MKTEEKREKFWSQGTYNFENSKALHLMSVNESRREILENDRSKTGSDCRTKSSNERLTVVHGGVKNTINPN